MESQKPNNDVKEPNSERSYIVDSSIKRIEKSFRSDPTLKFFFQFLRLHRSPKIEILPRYVSFFLNVFFFTLQTPYSALFEKIKWKQIKIVNKKSSNGYIFLDQRVDQSWKWVLKNTKNKSVYSSFQTWFKVNALHKLGYRIY